MVCYITALQFLGDIVRRRCSPWLSYELHLELKLVTVNTLILQELRVLGVRFFLLYDRNNLAVHALDEARGGIKVNLIIRAVSQYIWEKINISSMKIKSILILLVGFFWFHCCQYYHWFQYCCRFCWCWWITTKSNQCWNQEYTLDKLK